MQGYAFLGWHWYCAPFWRLDVPQTPKFAAWIGIFKPKMQIFKFSYYENYCSDSNKILHNDQNHQVHVVGHPKMRPTNFKIAVAAILKKNWKIARSDQPFDLFWQSVHSVMYFWTVVFLLGITLILHPILWSYAPVTPFWGHKFAFSSQTHNIF